MRPPNRGAAASHGFALVEGVTVLTVASLVAALVLVAGHEQRRLGRLGEDMGKLRSIGGLTAQYAADNADRFWTFSWRSGQSLSQYPDLNNAPNDIQAAANQAVDILRRQVGRTDIAAIVNWVPYTLYSHLPLLDHSGKVPDEVFLSAADANRARWARDPRGFDLGLYQPAPTGTPPGTNNGKRWPYGSSFQLPTCFYDKGTPPNRISPGPTHSTYLTPPFASLGGYLVSDVAFPAHKAHLFDQNARHFGTKLPYCTHDEARLPVLFVDGGVSVKAATESNPGWNPNNPASGSSGVTFSYQPDTWEPPAFSGGTFDQVTGRLRWTRGGHMGRDFGGPEVCTGQPSCP